MAAASARGGVGGGYYAVFSLAICLFHDLHKVGHLCNKSVPEENLHESTVGLRGFNNK